MPPKGFEKAPGRKEKVDSNNRGKSNGDKGNREGALKKGPTLREKVDKNAETLDVVSKSLRTSGAAVRGGVQTIMDNGEGGVNGEGGGGDGQGVVGM